MSLNPNDDKSAMWINETPLSADEVVKLIRQQGPYPD